MACHLPPDACRRECIASRLDEAEAIGTDWKARCPNCGHGGFRISQPTLTKMRNMWTCHCQICGGGHGCTGREVRAALLARKIRPWCLGSYLGKDKPKVDLDRLLKIAQTVDDVVNSCPVLSAAEIVMALAEARGDKIPGDYSGCAKFAKGLGMSNGNAYNVAAMWTAGSGSRPSGSEVPPQTGGGSEGLQSYHAEPERCQTPRSELQNLPEVGNDDSKSWKESALDEASGIPRVGKRTQGNTKTKGHAA